MSLTQLSRSIDGLVAVITGAGSGMGAATAKLFADQGAKVAAPDLNEASVAGVVQEITRCGQICQSVADRSRRWRCNNPGDKRDRRAFRRHRSAGEQCGYFHSRSD